MAKNKTVKKSVLTSIEAVDLALLELGKLATELSTAEATMNDAIQKLREEFNTKYQEKIDQRDIYLENIELFCNENKTLFESPRKKELTHGTIGFQTNPPAVGLLSKKYNWKTVLELMRKFRTMKKFIRTKEEVDKEAILIEALKKKTKLTDEKLAAVGLKTDQGETFICDIKWESISENKLSAPAA